MKIRVCKHCGDDFNPFSQRKREVGGYVNECPDCVEELETEEVIEIVEEINNIGIENLNQVSEKVIEVISVVVEETINIIQDDPSELCEYYLGNHTTEPVPPWLVC